MLYLTTVADGNSYSSKSETKGQISNIWKNAKGSWKESIRIPAFFESKFKRAT